MTVMARIPSIGDSQPEEVGESRGEAERLNLKLYLGKLCKGGHRAIVTGKGILNLTLRYKCTDCVLCSKQSKKSKAYAERDAKKVEAGKFRHSIEDRKLAKSMGITVEELLN